MRILLVFLISFCSSVLFAQNQRLVAKGQAPQVYILHPVKAQESFNSIAELYNLSPDTLSAYNNLEYYDGRVLAKALRVPLTKHNFIQRGEFDSTTRTAVVHLAGYDEPLEEIAKNYKLSVSALVKWNKVSKTGPVYKMPLIVGFVRSKSDTSFIAEANKNVEIPEKRAIKPLTKAEKEKIKADSIVAAKAAKKIEDNRKLAEALIEKKRQDSIAVVVSEERKAEKKRIAAAAALETKRLADLAIEEKKNNEAEAQRKLDDALREKQRLADLAAEEKANKAAEKKRKLEEDLEKKRLLAEEKANKAAEEKRLVDEAANEKKRLADLAAEEKANKATEEKRNLEEKKRLAAEARANKAAEEKRKLDDAAIEKKRLADLAIEEKANRAAEAKRKLQEAENEKKRLAEAAAEEKANKAAEEKRKLEEKKRIAAEQKANREAEAKRKLEAAEEEKTRLANLAIEEKANRALEEKRKLDEKKRVAAELKANREAEAKRKLEAAEEEKTRLANLAIEEKANKALEEKRKLDEKNRLAAEQKANKEADAKRKLAAGKKRQDSIAVAKIANEKAEKERLREEFASAIRRLDSIETAEKIRKDPTAAFTKKKKDSIAAVARAERQKRLDDIAVEKRRLDSIATAETSTRNIETDAKKAEERRLLAEAGLERKRLDSIAKAEALIRDRTAILKKRELDSIAAVTKADNAKKLADAALEKKKAEALTNAEKTTRDMELAAEKAMKAMETARENKRTDSIAAVVKANKNKQANGLTKVPVPKIIKEKNTKLDSATSIAKVPGKEKIAPPVVEVIDSAEVNLVDENRVITIQGFFEGYFSARASNGKLKEKAGEAAIFQSRTGWDDKKYYVLMNGLPAGTFVRIITADTKSVYAKVLGTLPVHKDNAGLLLRLSDAAASALGFEENGTQPVNIYYY